MRAVLPQLPSWAAPIRLHHLVHHTAGLPATADVLTAVGGTEGSLDNDLVLAGLIAVGASSAPPGATFRYSNLGYVLIAEMLARTMGAPLPRLVDALLLRPLRLLDARWEGPRDESHHTSETGPPPRTVGDGGLWITARDLHAWLDALDRRELGADFSRLTERGDRLAGGADISYAWGTTRRAHPAGPRFTHGGDWPGWTAKTLRQPSTGVAVALMTEGADAIAVTDVVDRIAEQLTRAR